MTWKKILLYIKSKKQASSYNLDRRLFSGLTKKNFPTWSQLRYIKEFIPLREKIILGISSLIAITTIVAWGSITLFANLESIPKNGGEYSEALVGQPKYVNPIFSSANEVDTDLASLIYSGLFKFNSSQELVPDLAENYTLSEDKKIYAIKLRENILWSDKEKLTTTDVAFTIQTIQDINVGSPLAVAFQGVKIEIVDDYNISLILDEPFPPFINNLTVGILPEHIWSTTNQNNLKLSKTNLQPIGSGPWMFNSLTKDETGTIQTYKLVHNKNYYGREPYLETLNFKFYQTYEQALNALRSNDVKAISFLPRKQRDKIPGKEFTLYQLQLPQYTALFFNQNQNLYLQNDSLRLALAQAIDKKRILQESLSGEGKVIHSPILNPELEKYSLLTQVELNIDKANELLDKTWKRIEPEDYFKKKKDEILAMHSEEIKALRENSSSTPDIVSSTIDQINQNVEDQVRETMDAEQSFYRQDKNGEILSLNITTADTEEYQKAAEIIAGSWKKLGIQITINSISSKQISSDTIKNRNYEILLYAVIVGSDPDLYPFWHSSQINYPGLNLAKFSNSKADKLIEQARTTDNVDEQNEFFKKFQDIINEEIPAIFLYTPTYTFVANNDIKGISDTRIFSPSDRYNNLENWYIKTKKKWKN